jgi:hypothetical protein
MPPFGPISRKDLIAYLRALVLMDLIQAKNTRYL